MNFNENQGKLRLRPHHILRPFFAFGKHRVRSIQFCIIEVYSLGYDYNVLGNSKNIGGYRES